MNGFADLAMCVAVYPRPRGQGETTIQREPATGRTTPERAEFATLAGAVPFARGHRYVPTVLVLRALVRSGHPDLVTPAEHAALDRLAYQHRQAEASSSYRHSGSYSTEITGRTGRIPRRRGAA